jgi:hypothetical protein
MHQSWEYRALYAWMDMKEFRARDIDADPSDPSFHRPLTVWLNELGAEGFEVIAATPLVADIGAFTESHLQTTVLYMLKRPLVIET